MKYYLMSEIYCHCIGMDGFERLLKLKNGLSGRDAEYYFRMAAKEEKDGSFIPPPETYKLFEEGLSAHWNFYKELSSLSEKDVE